MPQQLVYEVDDRDRIVAVGAEWQTFADVNGGESLRPSALLGRPLFDFIADATVRDVYRALLRKARSGRAVRFRFRRDAQTSRGDFEMIVAATAPARVSFASTRLRECVRPERSDFGHSPRPAALVRMCSWCHAIGSDADDWQPLESAIATLRLLEPDRHLGVTHGICPACVERIFRALEAEN